jgi:hypothetical protein
LEGEKRGKLYGKLGRGGIKEGKRGIRDWMRGGEDMNGGRRRGWRSEFEGNEWDGEIFAILIGTNEAKVLSVVENSFLSLSIQSSHKHQKEVHIAAIFVKRQSWPARSRANHSKLLWRVHSDKNIFIIIISGPSTRSGEGRLSRYERETAASHFKCI